MVEIRITAETLEEWLQMDLRHNGSDTEHWK